MTEAQALGLKVENWTPNQFLQHSIPKHGHFILNRNSGIDFIDDDLLCLKQWKKRGHFVGNDPDLAVILRDKSKQYSYFSQLSIPMIDTWDMPQTMEEFENCPLGQRALPWMIKTIRGNQGQGQFVINRAKDFQNCMEVFQKKNDFNYILQPFLEGAGEYRFVVLNGKIQWKVKKKDKTDRNHKVLTNFETYESVNSAKAEKWIQKICDKHQVFFASFDFFLFKDTWYLLEVNNIPGIIQLEKATGENVARTILEQILLAA